MPPVDGKRVPARLFFLLLTLLSGPATAALQAVHGEARDPTGRLLFREQHLIRSDGGRPLERVVLYRCPGGVAFARKRVDYRASRNAPEFALVDARGYREGLRRDGDRALVWSGSKPERALVKAAAALVADAGFDEFLRAHWDALLAGRAQTLAFVVPAFGRSLPFQVRSLGGGELDGVAVQRFRLKLDGLLGVVGPSMEVAYASADQRLRRFDGLTNLRDDRGGQLHARIDFALPAHAATDAAWRAALATPLTRCKLGG